MIVIPGLDEIKRLRKKNGLSQEELAKMVKISQPHLAKIESKKVDPSYDLVCRIFKALAKATTDDCGLYMSRNILKAYRGDRIDDIIIIMNERGYSQVPVFDGDRPIGMLTEMKLMMAKRPYSRILVEDVMEDFVMVPDAASCDSIIPLIEKFHAVLVERNGKVAGIITATDLVMRDLKPDVFEGEKCRNADQIRLR